MFGLGFSEILMILIVAVIFLGPDKLPEAAIQIAKFFKSFKKVVTDAKSTLEEDLKLSELKQEALSYKESLENTASELTQSASVHDSREVKDLFSDLTGTFDDVKDGTSLDQPKREIVQFPKKETPTPVKEETHA